MTSVVEASLMWAIATAGALLVTEGSASAEKPSSEQATEESPVEDGNAASAQSKGRSAQERAGTDSSAVLGKWGSGLEPGSIERSRADDPGQNEAGFYLRLTVGGGTGWAHAGATGDQPELSIQWWTGNGMLQHGYQFTRRFAVHADLYGAWGAARTIENDQQVLGYVPQGTVLAMMTLGPGFSYHTLSEDLFISAGGGIAAAYGTQWTVVTDRVPVVTPSLAITNPGYGGHGSVGKLFSVAGRWSLGLSLHYNFQMLGRVGSDILSVQTFHSLWLGVANVIRP